MAKTGKTRNRGNAVLTGQAKQGHQIMATRAPRSRFAGVNMPKSKRRSNGARPRKMYPYVRKDQKGTPMETNINKNYAEFQRQINDGNPSGPGRFSQDRAQGRLGTHWGNIKKRMTSGKAISDHVSKNGGSVQQAHTTLVGRTDVSFGADPKQK